MQSVIKLEEVPVKTETRTDYEAVLQRLMTGPCNYSCTYEEGRRINTWVRNVTGYGLSQKAIRDNDGTVIGYRFILTEGD